MPTVRKRASAMTTAEVSGDAARTRPIQAHLLQFRGIVINRLQVERATTPTAVGLTGSAR